MKSILELLNMILLGGLAARLKTDSRPDDGSCLPISDSDNNSSPSDSTNQ